MDTKTLQQIWERFIDTGELDAGMNPVVAQSWEKCRKSGLNPLNGRGKRVDDVVFRSILEENKDLLETALPVMQSVYEIVKQSHFLLVLTDSLGYILETIGDPSVQKMSKDLEFVKGALWSDLEVGSNAIGMALDYDVAIQTVGPEHYCLAHHNWTCSAAPIHGTDGEIIGCLDISGDAAQVHPHSLGLIVATAFSIETMIARLQSTKLMREALDGSEGSILLLDEDFHPIWANRATEKYFGISLKDIRNTDFRQMTPDMDWSQIQQWVQKGQYLTSNTRLLLGNKVHYCSASVSPTLEVSSRTFTVTLRKQEHLIDTVNKFSGNRATYNFSSIYAQDPLMKKTVQLAQKYALYDGTVLIEGESGTGKELFAQAIHNRSSRAEGPFVAVNCASLPRDLIESELFGYEKGAFTGALKEGNPGKFELANHGTLFLDEIGEMPLEFQAKLLRAVETLSIRRLGGKQEKQLDLRVIAATNRDLQRESELGRFRKDLYYRLNVLKLNIPPLRERPQDITHCAQLFLDHFNSCYPDHRKQMSPGFLGALRKYEWPGNVRELQNLIERLFYTCSDSLLKEEDFLQIKGETRGSASVRDNVMIGERREEIINVLMAKNGQIEDAAQELGVSRATFYRMCKRFDVKPKELRKSNSRFLI